jgi:hypothetical protein
MLQKVLTPGTGRGRVGGGERQGVRSGARNPRCLQLFTNERTRLVDEVDTLKSDEG